MILENPTRRLRVILGNPLQICPPPVQITGSGPVQKQGGQDSKDPGGVHPIGVDLFPVPAFFLGLLGGPPGVRHFLLQNPSLGACPKTTKTRGFE